MPSSRTRPMTRCCEASDSVTTRSLRGSSSRLPAQALPLWMQAGERALARFANDEAVKHFEKAIEVAGQLPDVCERACAVLAGEVGLGQAQATAGRPLEATATFQRAAELARHANDASALFACAMGFDHAEFLANEPLDKSVSLLNEALSLVE